MSKSSEKIIPRKKKKCKLPANRSKDFQSYQESGKYELKELKAVFPTRLIITYGRMVVEKETCLHILARRLLSLRKYNACYYSLHRKNRLHICVSHPTIKGAQFQIPYTFTP